jgi:3-hydroxybutyryl-CoA dehydrogenase
MSLEKIAVLGGGTMGGGVAQVALAAGYRVALYDVSEVALERTRERIAGGLAKQGRGAAIGGLHCISALDAIAGSRIVVEAAPERLELKQELLRKAAAICPAPAIIASNTSSLPIAALAAVCANPERVAGLHFFNPVHRMALVELVRAPQTDAATVEALLAFSARIGKTAVQARDTPGFIVNRVARPFYGEALRLLGDGAADVVAIDTLLERAGRFPLGPFALMDLIGVDINFAVTCSVYEQMFHEPRLRPHPIQRRLVLEGAHGRKSGRGFYDYSAGAAPPRPELPPAPALAGAVLISGGSWGPTVGALCADAGLRVLPVRDTLPASELHAAFVLAGHAEGAARRVEELDGLLDPAIPILAQCVDTMASELAQRMGHPERLVGFDGLFTDGALSLVASPLLHPSVRAAVDTLAYGLRRVPIWLADTPAQVVPRVVAQLANEAAFALGEGVASREAIDTAMRLGTNHPLGPLARAEQLGYARVVAILDHLWAELREERYRVAPALRQAARTGILSS